MTLRLRVAGPQDAQAVALLHADSWRRHYRGAYADSFLDGDIEADRITVWSARLSAPVSTATVLAEDDDGLAGFVHVIFDNHESWGSLVDNLHVTSVRRRTGIGSVLLNRAAAAVAEQAAARAMYLKVLEQNTAAQKFYQACGGTVGERIPTGLPGGVPGRLNGVPYSFRVTWPDVLEFDFLSQG